MTNFQTNKTEDEERVSLDSGFIFGFQRLTAVVIGCLPHRVNTCPDAANANESIAHLALYLLRPLGLAQTPRTRAPAH